jgi:hypothetical protein
MARGDRPETVVVEIAWHVNPLRGDRFRDGWLPMTAAVVDYGATWWAFLRDHEGGLDFIQLAAFPSKTDFERYWYSERVAEKRVELSGYYQIPLLPKYHEVVASGDIAAPSRAA